MMKIAVCLSQGPDTTTPIKIAADNCSIETQGIQWVINPWDELTLTRAIELRKSADSQVTELVVVHAGGVDAEPVIEKRLLSVPIVPLELIPNPRMLLRQPWLWPTILKRESYDLILTGLEVG